MMKQFEQLQNKMVDSRSRMQVAEMQIKGRTISNRKAQLTTAEIGKLPDDVRMYRSVGRMFLLEAKGDAVKRITAEVGEGEKAIEKYKQEKAYLERQYKESEGALREMLSNR